jgi:hypothetical protein
MGRSWGSGRDYGPWESIEELIARLCLQAVRIPDSDSHRAFRKTGRFRPLAVPIDEQSQAEANEDRSRDAIECLRHSRIPQPQGKGTHGSD